MKRKREQAGFKQGGRKGNVKKRRVDTVLFQPTGTYGVEKKFFNSSIVQEQIPQSLAVLTGGELNNIAQGDDADD